MLKQTELKGKGIRTYPTFWSPKDSVKFLQIINQIQFSLVSEAPVRTSAQGDITISTCVLQGIDKRWNSRNTTTILVNSGGDSSVFRHFRLLIYLFLLSEYLSVPPEGVQTNEALHHLVTQIRNQFTYIKQTLSFPFRPHVPPV